MLQTPDELEEILKRSFNAVVECSSSSFTWKDFLDLNHPERSHNTPLLVIAHIDVNAFFAQLEQLRLGLSSNDPVVCVQWSSLIAVSYAARKYGINRMDSLESARKKCPNLILAHTAVFRKGEPNWSYREAGVLPKPETHKVSLDPYRRESRKMMRIFRSKCDKVEKASVDESFMDFGRLIFNMATELFPVLRNPPADLALKLPQVPKDLPPQCEFKGEVIHNNNENKESSDRFIYDWDDVFIMIGSQVALEVRQEIESELGYTTSCGISRVKTVSKLASGFIKPDNQTIVRSSAIATFCENFDVTDFWSMGGKTGQMIQLKLLTPSEGSIAYIRENFSLNELQDKLRPDIALANQLYKMVRGELYMPLSLRTDVKSMGASKNFRGKSVSSINDILEWMPVFTGDVLQRLQELDEESGILSGDTNNKIIRRPKTISFNFRTATFNSYSRQCSLPLILQLEKVNDLIYKNGCKLAKSVVDTWDEFANGELFPLSHFGISITNFEEMDPSRSIDEFAVKGASNDEIINSLFAELDNEEKTAPTSKEIKKKPKGKEYDIFLHLASGSKKRAAANTDDPRYCEECDKLIVDEEMSSHKDFHFALKLSKEFGVETSHGNDTPSKTMKKKKKLDKGQSTLPFSR